MSICGFGFRTIIVVFMLCIILGGLGVYFNAKISNLEKSMVSQNLVLTDIITNIKSDIVDSSEGVAKSTSTNNDVGIVMPLEKIGVSENDDSEIDDSEIDDSEINDSSIDDDNVVSEVVDVAITNNLPADISINSVGIMDISSIGGIGVIIQELTNISSPGPAIVELSEDKQIKLGDVSSAEQLDKLSVESNETSNKVDVSDNISNSSSINFKKMKLNELKNIASSKGIDSKGKKKCELVDSLTKH